MNRLIDHFTLQPYEWRTYIPESPMTVPFVDAQIQYRESRFYAHYDTRILLGCSFKVDPQDGIDMLGIAAHNSIQHTLGMIYGETYAELANLQRQLMMGLDKRVACDVIANIMKKIEPRVEHGDLIVNYGHIKVNHEKHPN